VFVWRKDHGRLNSQRRRPEKRETEKERGEREKREREKEIDRGDLPPRIAVLRAHVSRNSCGAGTDISQKMNHPYTNEPTHCGNSGTIVRQ